jgi:2-iminobutanoate/2-iminopropanoate deaminase
MNKSFANPIERVIAYTAAEKRERRALGLPVDEPSPAGILRRTPAGSRPIPKRALVAPQVLNEASAYGSAFCRGLRMDLPGGVVQLLVSGTAAVSETGETLYPGDFRAQCWRTFRNITALLENGGASWQDIVRTTCYLRDIERDYDQFNSVRTEFYSALGLDPVPPSTGVQARLCRSDLLVEIEAIAMFIR